MRKIKFLTLLALMMGSIITTQAQTDCEKKCPGKYPHASRVWPEGWDPCEDTGCWAECHCSNHKEREELMKKIEKEKQKKETEGTQQDGEEQNKESKASLVPTIPLGQWKSELLEMKKYYEQTGQTNTEGYRKTLEYIGFVETRMAAVKRRQETVLPGTSNSGNQSNIQRDIQNKNREFEQKMEAVTKATSHVAEGIAMGVADGSITSLELAIGLRTFTDEELESNSYRYSLSSYSYELGLGIGEKGSFSLGFMFPEGGIGGLVGARINLFHLDLDGFERYISLGTLIEGGYVSSSEDPLVIENYSEDSTSFFAPGLYLSFLDEWLFVSYSYGWSFGEHSKYDKGTRTRANTSLDTNYSKLGLGINIQF